MSTRASSRQSARLAAALNKNGKRNAPTAPTPAPSPKRPHASQKGRGRAKPGARAQQEEAEDEEDEEEAPDYNRRTVVQLKALAKDRGITNALKSRLKKAQIVKAIQAFDRQQAEAAAAEEEEEEEEEEEDTGGAADALGAQQIALAALQADLDMREADIEKREKEVEKREDDLENQSRSTDSPPSIRTLNEREFEKMKDHPHPPLPELINSPYESVVRVNGEDVGGWYAPETTVPSTQEGAGVWEFRKNVGAGGFGSCSLWTKKKLEENKVVDRLVLKDQVIAGTDAHNKLYWREPTSKREKPLEAELHSRVSMRNNRCFVKYRGFTCDKDNNTHRMYLDYARFGSLRGLLNQYAAAGALSKNESKAWHPDDLSTHKVENCIPEPFIWYVARQLTMAAKTMETGFRSKDGDDEEMSSDEDEPKWMKIVHRDIKPENILMSDRVYDHIAYDAYVRVPEAEHDWPNILLTDFGISVELRPEFKNPQDFTGNGTVGYQPPEVMRQMNRDPQRYPVEPMGAKTNIWGIGAVLYDMMNPRIRENKGASGGPALADKSRIAYHQDMADGMTNGPKHLKWRQVYGGPSLRNQQAPVDPMVYTSALREFVTKCVAFHQRDRPSLEQMEETIDENLADWFEKRMWRNPGDLHGQEILKPHSKCQSQGPDDLDEFRLNTVRRN